MADIVSSLFGLSPMDTQQQIEQEDMRNALAIANLPQGKRAAYTGQLIGTKLARGLLSGFGIQDPRLQRATTIEEALKEVNDSLTDEEKANPFTLYSKVADTFAAKGLQQESAMARAKAQEAGLAYQGKLSEINRNLAAANKDTSAIGTEAFKALPEIERLSVRAAEAKAAGNTKLFNDLNAQISKLNEQQQSNIENELVLLDRIRRTRPLSVAEQKSFDDLFSLKERLNRASSTSVNVKEGVQAGYGGAEDAIKEQNKLLIPRIDSLNKALGAATTAKNMLENTKMIMGANAEGRVALANFLDTIGASDSAVKLRAANSQEFSAIVGEQVMASVKALGANPSNSDREFAIRTVANLGNTPEAAKKIADYIVQKVTHEREQAIAQQKHNFKVLGKYSTGKAPSEEDVFEPKVFNYSAPKSQVDIDWLHSNKSQLNAILSKKTPLTDSEKTLRNKAITIMQEQNLTEF